MQRTVAVDLGETPYFSDDLNAFMIQYSQCTDPMQILQVSSTVLTYYNELTKFLFLDKPQAEVVGKLYLDELYRAAHDYYQKMYYLVLVRSPKVMQSMTLDGNALRLYTSLRETLIQDISILRIRKYLAANAVPTKSFLETHQVSLPKLHMWTKAGTALVVDYRSAQKFQNGHIQVPTVVNVYPSGYTTLDEPSFPDLRFENLLKGCASTEHSLLLERIAQFEHIVVIVPDASYYHQLLPLFLTLIGYFILNGIPVPDIRSCVVDLNQWATIGGRVAGPETASNKTTQFQGDSILVGLENEHNSCYINCVIQCLLPIRSLTMMLLTNSYLNNIDYSNPVGSKGKTITTLASLIQTMYRTKENNRLYNQQQACSCLKLKRCCGEVNPMFNSDQEEDSHEFLEFLINTLHEDLRRGSNVIIPQYTNPANQVLTQDEKARLAWAAYMQKEANFMVDTFQGQTISSLQCRVCNYTSDSFQVFSTLSLTLPLGASCNIYDCLNQYFRPEELNGENGWDCPSCKVKRPAVKNSQLTRLPKVLVCQLNRFSSYSTKNNCFVKYPYELDLGRYRLDVEGSARFRLFGVVCHTGNLDKGHYSSYVFKSGSQWWYIDDTVSRPLHFATEFISLDAYMLFFERVN